MFVYIHFDVKGLEGNYLPNPLTKWHKILRCSALYISDGTMKQWLIWNLTQKSERPYYIVTLLYSLRCSFTKRLSLLWLSRQSLLVIVQSNQLLGHCWYAMILLKEVSNWSQTKQMFALKNLKTEIAYYKFWVT